MNRIRRPLFALVLMTALTLAPAAVGQNLPPIDTSGDADGVVPLPSNVPSVYRSAFRKYAKVTAPNGKAIHVLAQSGVSDLQVARARDVLGFYLANVPGARFGADKTAVANSMGNRGAMLFYFTSERAMEQALNGSLGETRMNAQPLFATESPVEGSSAWLRNTTRDATFEEIFHLVHDQGILPTDKAFQREIQTATSNAMSRGLWEALPEWIQEGSTTQEYIISVFDVYMGLWAHDPDGEGTSFYGEYKPLNRADLKRKDPKGYALMEMFHPDHLDFEARLDPSFDGVFSTTLENGKVYTLKSQYLSHVTLTGSKSSGLRGNERANRLTGNSGNNRLTGEGGNDRLDGGAGADVAVYQGHMSDYVVTTSNGVTTVRDKVAGRDGQDEVRRVDHLEFRDGTLAVDGSGGSGGNGSGDTGGGGDDAATAPLSPARLRAEAVSRTAVRLTWRDRSDNETRFIVERKRPGRKWQRVTAVRADRQTVRDGGLRRDTVYVYRVRAENAAGRSKPSATARVSL